MKPILKIYYMLLTVYISKPSHIIGARRKWIDFIFEMHYLGFYKSLVAYVVLYSFVYI